MHCVHTGSDAQPDGARPYLPATCAPDQPSGLRSLFIDRKYSADLADAHDCIMVRIQTDRPNTSLRREEMRPNGELPSDFKQASSAARASKKCPSRGSLSSAPFMPAENRN